MLRYLTWALLATLGCSDEERSVVTDEGAVCLDSTPSGGLSVRVEFPQCLSSSCDRSISATCSISRSGSELRIESQSVVESDKGAELCTLDCGTVSATCALDSVEPGDYAVVHGRKDATARLPATALALFGDASSFFAQPCD